MKYSYPVIISKTEDKVPYFVEIPDLEAMTQGTSFENAVEMAKDCIKVCLEERIKRGQVVPAPTEIGGIIAESTDVTAVESVVE